MVRSLGSRGPRVLPPNSAIRGGAVHPRRWVYLPELARYIGIWGYTVRVHKRLPKLTRFPEPRGLTELLFFWASAIATVLHVSPVHRSIPTSPVSSLVP